MKIHFKTLAYQKNAVQAVIDCFQGQNYSSGQHYLIDQGVQKKGPVRSRTLDTENEIGFENAPLFDEGAILKNIRAVQTKNGLPLSDTLITEDIDKGKQRNLTGSRLNLDIEMETGTGKTYCYIRTMFELNKQYGWSKFIVVVPSVAIREGVQKSFSMMSDHFLEQYGQKARFFIYDSKALYHLENFSTDKHIHVMIINVQAFNATGKENRRIYEELDTFQSRRPIDVIQRNRPILILDEPQKMQAEKTLLSLANFNPLFILRYSATHKRHYNLIYRLDALDAYNQKLVKKITVKGIEVKNLQGTHGYLYLQDILISKTAPFARIELEIATKTGFKREIRKVTKGDNLFEISHHAEQYRHYVVAEIDATQNCMSFTNGQTIEVGKACGHIDEKIMRTIQIREAIRAHLQKERQLFRQGIKVLSLFFIDEVAKYRQYDDLNQPIDGEYVTLFKEQYQHIVATEYQADFLEAPYRDYLAKIDVNQTHNGYFAIDKKSKRLIDPNIDKKAEENQISNDTDAYDLILKDKERLLSFEEPTRFIFSHSALREGWDNPNVFVICTLKYTQNTISRRQEVGRGLRLAVNQHGERMDADYFGAHSHQIHQLNNLTVITNESYTEFVSHLQTEIATSLTNRSFQASLEYFTEKQLFTEEGKQSFVITPAFAKIIHDYLREHHYIDQHDYLTTDYHEAKLNQTLAALPEPFKAYPQQVLQLIDGVSDLKRLTANANQQLENPIRTENLKHQAFQALWQRINRKAVYQIQLDSDKLIQESIAAIEQTAAERHGQFVETLNYQLAEATQKEKITYTNLQAGNAFGAMTTKTESVPLSIQSQVKYDLIGNISEATNLTRLTIAHILHRISPTIFAQYPLNPEAFIREIIRILNIQQAKMIVHGLTYHLLDQTYALNEVFISNESIPITAFKANRHVLDYVVTDSAQELDFVKQLEQSAEVIVYAKLPDRFYIPTPFGHYTPDWAIVLDCKQVRYIYFVVETKGAIVEATWREQEKQKIESAKKFFAALNQENHMRHDRYDRIEYRVMSKIEDLMTACYTGHS